jgi:hypothetical protein
MALLRRGPKLPDTVRGALALGSGERVLSWGSDAAWTTVVATNHRLCAVNPGGDLVAARPWHEVDAGSWSSELGQLTVTWVDGSRPAQWVLGDASLLPETVRERVQASVVLTQSIDFGPRRRARVAVRQDLATGDLVEQVVLGRGARSDDAELAAATRAAAAYLREQVGR